MSGVRASFSRFVVLIGQIGLLWLLNEGARHAAAFFPFPIPGGAIGLAGLYLLLSSGWVRLSWIERGATFLVRHLGLFLVPFGVGFMAFGDVLSKQGVALLLVLVGCTAIGIAATGMASMGTLHLSQRLRRFGRGVLHE